jgi:sterol desaturase/sphingolipid hydroxylase (fatty acid hydroxylase superfamily)
LLPELASWPAWARFPLAFLVAELGFYWGHRWMHASPLLWRFHALHHGATSLDWLVNTRAHPLDLVFLRLCGLLPLYVSGLVQVNPAAGQIDALPLIVTLVGNIWGYFLHANLRWRFGLLEHLVATPNFHHWHHVHLGDAGHAQGNYAALLPVMDRLFGSLHGPADSWPPSYGNQEPPPAHWLDQLMAPFMEVIDRLFGARNSTGR